MASNEEEEGRKSIMFLGRDLTQIPCMRNSILYGFTAGVCTFLGTFLFTSRPRISSHMGMGVYTVFTLVYFTRCRYIHALTSFNMNQIQELVQQAVVMEGTEDHGVIAEVDKDLVDV